MTLDAGTLIASLLLGLAAGCACDPDDVAFDLAGGDARSCGQVAIGASTSATDACVIEAFRARHSFVARFDRLGRDSEVATLLAFDGTTLWVLLYDGSPCGGDSCGSRIEGVECDEPIEQVIDGRTTVTCPLTASSKTLCD